MPFILFKSNSSALYIGHQQGHMISPFKMFVVLVNNLVFSLPMSIQARL